MQKTICMKIVADNILLLLFQKKIKQGISFELSAWQSCQSSTIVISALIGVKNVIHCSCDSNFKGYI